VKPSKYQLAKIEKTVSCLKDVMVPLFITLSKRREFCRGSMQRNMRSLVHSVLYAQKRRPKMFQVSGGSTLYCRAKYEGVTKFKKITLENAFDARQKIPLILSQCCPNKKF
jgi:hypothetical protein